MSQVTDPQLAIPPRTDRQGYHQQLRHGRSRAAVHGVLWSFLHTLVPSVSSAGVFFVGAWYLTPVDFGLVGLAAGLVGFAVALIPVAFGQALVQRQIIDPTHTDSVFWLNTGVGGLFCLIFVLGAGMLAAMVGEPGITPLLAVLALKIPLEALAAVPNALIVRSMRFKMLALRTTIATLVSVAIAIAMLVSGYGYWALIVSQVAASLVLCAMAYWVTGWRPGLQIRLSALRDLSRFGIFASGDRLLTTMRLDHIVLGAFGGAHMLGLYFFAQRLFMMLTSLVSGALSSVSHALLSTLQGEAEKTRRAFLLSSFASTALSIPMFTGLALITDDLLTVIFDPRWAAAATPIRAFCILGILASIGVAQGTLMRSQGKADWWFYYQLAQQSGTIVVILALYPFGISAVVLGVAAKSVLLWPVSVVLTARLLNSRPISYLAEFRAPVISTAAMALAVLAVPVLWPDLPPGWRIAAQIAAGITLYLPLILFLARDHIRLVRQAIRPKES